jgi:restriction system protein
VTLWVVKGGRAGEREDRFLDRSVVGIGWEELPDLNGFGTREDLKAAYRSLFPGSSEGNVAVQVGQLWAFAHTMQPGDLVVVPLKRRGQIAIGRIKGPYRHAADLGADLSHVRDVEWLVRDLPRTAFEKDLLYSFGSAQTVSTASRNNAEQRVAAILKSGPSTFPVPLPPTPEDATETATDRDLEQDGRDEIIDFIRSHFKGHGLGRIVDGVLRAQGFATRVSPPGPDGGVDIVARGGVMGFDEPRIVVQVKSQQSPADVSILRELKGTMSDFAADQGLLVCWGGFKDTLIREARNGFFKIRLWDQEALLSALFANYERLDEDLRAELPLKRIWTLAREGVIE